MPTGIASPDGTRSQLWITFVRNHASAVLACDFFVAITTTFRVFYVFVVLKVGTRRLTHRSVTEHPQPTGRRSSSGWSSQAMSRIDLSFTITTASTRRV